MHLGRDIPDLARHPTRDAAFVRSDHDEAQKLAANPQFRRPRKKELLPIVGRLLCRCGTHGGDGAQSRKRVVGHFDRIVAQPVERPGIPSEVDLPGGDDGFEIRPADGGGKNAPPIGKVAVIVLVKRLEQRGEVVGGEIRVDHLRRSVRPRLGAQRVDGHPHRRHGVAALRRAVVSHHESLVADLHRAGGPFPQRHHAADPFGLRGRVPIVETVALHRRSRRSSVAGHDRCSPRDHPTRSSATLSHQVSSPRRYLHSPGQGVRHGYRFEALGLRRCRVGGAMPVRPPDRAAQPACATTNLPPATVVHLPAVQPPGER